MSPEKTLYTKTIIKFNSYVMMMEVYGSPHNEDLLGSRMNSFYFRRVHAYIPVKVRSDPFHDGASATCMAR